MTERTTEGTAKKRQRTICSPAQARVLSVIDAGGYVREYTSGAYVLFRRETEGVFWHAGAVARRTFDSLRPYLKPCEVQIAGLDGIAYVLKHPAARRAEAAQ